MMYLSVICYWLICFVLILFTFIIQKLYIYSNNNNFIMLFLGLFVFCNFCAQVECTVECTVSLSLGLSDILTLSLAEPHLHHINLIISTEIF